MPEKGAMDGHAERRAALTLAMGLDPMAAPWLDASPFAWIDPATDAWRLARTKDMTPPSLSPAFGRPASPHISPVNRDTPPSPLSECMHSPAGQWMAAPPGTKATPCP
jgi:hypothetical protein